MAKPTTCPEASELKRLAIADFAPEEMEPLLQHLQDCDACLSRVQTLAPKDTLVTVLAKAKSLAENPDDPVLTGLIARLAKLGEAPAAQPAPSKLNFACSKCGKNLKVKPELAGKKVKCPGCGQAVPVPQAPGRGTPSPGGADEKTIAPTSSNAADLSDQRTILPVGGDTNPGLSGVRDSRKKRPGDATQAMAPPKDEFDFLAPAQESDELGRLGQYRVLKKLGAGGMGMVLLAEDMLLHRQVALKVMLPQYAASEQARERFLREARAAAKVEHENVVTILQVGEDNDVPFLAMPFLKGKPLDEVLEKKRKLPVAEALRIAAEMAEGLGAAHAMGLIHRDIKPGNVWLETKARKESEKRKDETEPPPSSYKVKLLDFGLARSEDDTKLTQSGALIGTPAYMAPEQAKGESIDARADLFSLGCVLYVMLTGQRPFKGENTISLLTALALENPAAPQILNPDVPKEVSEFTMWLLEKNPNDRPASASEVATELAELRGDQAADETRLAGSTKRLRPIKSSAKQKRSWLGRVAVILAVVAGLTVGGLYLGGVILVPTPRGTLVIEIDDPNVEVLVKQGGVKLFDPTTKRQLDLKVGDYEIDIADTKEGWKFSTKEFTITRDGATKVKIWLDRAVAVNPLSNGVNLDPAKIPQEERYPGQPKELVAVLGEHRAWYRASLGSDSMCFSPDGKLLATSSGQIWDAQTLRLKHTLDAAGDYSVAIAADNKTVALGQYGSGLITLWDISRELPEKLAVVHLAAATSLSFGAKGKILAAASRQYKSAKVWDLAGEQPVEKVVPGKVQAVSLAPDGKTLASCGDDGLVRLWDVTTEKLQELAVSAKPAGGDSSAFRVLFSPSGKTIVSNHQFSNHEAVRMWEVNGKTLVARPMPKSPDDNATILAFDAEGKTLAIGPPSVAPGGIRLLDLSTPTPKIIKEFSGGHADMIQHACFAPDRKTLASVGHDGIVKLWDVTGKEPTERPVRGVGHNSAVLSLAFATDGKSLASGGGDRKLRIWDLSGPARRETAVGKGHDYPIEYLRFAPGGKSLISGHQLYTERADASDTYLWHLTPEGIKGRKIFEGMGQLRFARFGGDGKPQLVGFHHVSDTAKLRLWDVSDKGVKERATPKTPWPKAWPFVGNSALASNNKLLAFNVERIRNLTLPQRLIQVWDLDGPEVKERCALDHPSGFVDYVAFSPDGRTIFTAGSGSILAWDATNASQLFKISLTQQYSNSHAGVFAPDGKIFYAAMEGKFLVSYDAKFGSKNEEWPMPFPVKSLALSPDGRYLAAGNANGTIYILQVAKDAVVAVKPVETKPEEKPLPPGASPLDRLDPAQIAEDNRRPWLPKETVAVVGDLKGRMPEDVDDVVVSPDGKWLVACAIGPHVIHVYDAATLRFHCELRGPPGRSWHNVAFVSGNTLCAFSALWDLSPAEPVRLADLAPLDPSAVAAAPKAARLAAQYADGKIHLWDWVDGKLKERGAFSHSGKWPRMCFLPDGNTLISSDGGSLRLWDVHESTPRVISDLKDSAGLMAVSPDGKALATYEWNKLAYPEKVALWDLTNPKEPIKRTLSTKGPHYGRALAFSPDSTLLAVLSFDGNAPPCVQLWPVHAASLPKAEHEIRGAPRSVAFALDGKTLVVGATLIRSGSMQVFDFDGVKLTNRWRPHDAVLGPVFSPDGQTLTTSLPHNNSWWDLTAAAPSTRNLPIHLRNFSGFSRNGLFFVTEIDLSEWDGKKNRFIMNRPHTPHALTVDGGTAACVIPGGGVEFATIEAGKWQKTASFNVPDNQLALRSDGKALASSVIDNTPKPSSHLFQRDESGWKQTWSGTGPVALSARAGRFAAAEPNGILIFDIGGSQPREVAKLPPVQGANSIALSPDGSIVAVATRLGSVAVIDVESGLRPHSWQFFGGVNGVSFAPDGRHLAVGLQQGATLILRLPAMNGK